MCQKNYLCILGISGRHRMMPDICANSIEANIYAWAIHFCFIGFVSRYHMKMLRNIKTQSLFFDVCSTVVVVVDSFEKDTQAHIRMNCTIVNFIQRCSMAFPVSMLLETCVKIIQYK